MPVWPVLPASRGPAVEVVEVGPRDGLQNEPDLLPVTAKVELIRRLAAAGARRIEAVSFVNPQRVPQMADAEAVLAEVRDLPGVSLSGLVLNERGFDRAAGTGALREITFAVVTTETFNRRNQGVPVEETLWQWARIARRAAEAGLHRNLIVAAAFGCPFEGEVPVARVVEVARRACEAGADELALADTIGVATPRDVEERFAAVAAALPGVPLRAHFHNTRNTGYANADTALRSGVRALDSSLGGIGGCPFAPNATGNIATEDLAYMLARMGVDTGLSLPRLAEAARWLEGVLRRPVPGQVSRVPFFPSEAERAAA